MRVNVLGREGFLKTQLVVGVLKYSNGYMRKGGIKFVFQVLVKVQPGVGISKCSNGYMRMNILGMKELVQKLLPVDISK
jgi:hypothetical protein